MKNQRKIVFRIGNVEGDKGLWYDESGNFTGEIHTDLDFCRSSAFKMPYDEKLAKVWRSATGTADELLNWFNLEELKKMESYGYRVAIYSTTEYQTHIHIDPDTGMELPHLIFKIDKSELVDLVEVERFREMLSDTQ